MSRNGLNGLLPVVLLCCVSACSSDNDGDANEALERAVVKTYAANLRAAYADSVADALDFQTTVTSFLDAPSEPSLAAARSAWLVSREHYMATEGARFYGGPIDQEDESGHSHEAFLNSWPLDEAYIDYTSDQHGVVDESSGIVNRPDLLDPISESGLEQLNAEGGDENISTGYHAVEFLLWGQALKPVGPGERPASDYSKRGPRQNAERRAAYLEIAVQGIVSNLTQVRDAWSEDAAYRVQFEAAPKASLAKMLTGLAKFSKGELGSQRIGAAYASKERHDQHDCFSSETLVDYERDARGIQAMYLGSYGKSDGPGLDELVRRKDPELDRDLQAKLQASVDAIAAIPKPFEDAIAGDDGTPGRRAIQRALDALTAQGDTFGLAAKVLGLSIQVDDPTP